MRKISLALIVLVFSLVIAQGLCQAESLSVGELLKSAANVNEGFAYSFIDSQFKPTIVKTYPVLGIENIENLNAGFGVTTKEEKISLGQLEEVIGQISYTLLRADKINILKDIPVVNLLKVEPFVAAGYKDIGIHKSGDNEFDFLGGFNLISTKF